MLQHLYYGTGWLLTARRQWESGGLGGKWREFRGERAAGVIRATGAKVSILLEQ